MKVSILKKLMSSPNKSNEKDWNNYFEKLINAITDNYLISSNGRTYYIKDLEPYLSVLNSDKKTSISKAHGSPVQLINCKFYVHRYFPSEKFKPIKRIGLDITCGKEGERYCGLLIKSIEDSESGEIFTGQSKVLNQLVGNYKDGKYNKIKSDDFLKFQFEKIDRSDIFNCSKLKLIPQKQKNLFLRLLDFIMAA